MTRFRGVESKQILKSIDGALYYLSQLDDCPQIQDMVEEWYKSSEILDLIPLATTDEQLAHVLEETEATYFFYRFQEIFLSQALMHDNDAFWIYHDLASWGAFSAGGPFRRETIDDEVDSFLICNYLAQFKESDLEPGSLAYIRLQKAVEMLKAAADGGKIPFEACYFVERDFQTGLQAIRESMFEDGTLKAAFKMVTEDLEPQFRSFLKVILREMNNVNTNRVLVEGFSPLDHYRLVLPPEKDAQKLYGDLRYLANTLSMILEPYYRTGDVLNHRAVMVAGGGTPTSKVIFTGTRRAAQAVADYFPESEVFSSKGELVPPIRRLPGPSGPSPQP